MSSGAGRIQTERIVDRLVAEGLAALPDTKSAREALEMLGVLGGDRAVFAACVLTLELALLKDAQARADLPNRVGVLLEAYRDPKLANVLVAGSPELEARWNRIKPVVADFVALQRAPEPPPPPLIEELPLTVEEEPPEPPARPAPRLATPTELIEEIQEILEVEEAPAPPPPPPPPDALRRASKAPRPPEDPPVDPEARSFWAYAEKALGRVPDPNESLVGQQSFAAGRSSDRAHLVRFAHDLVARFPHERHARALAAMTLLYVAGQEKERGLLGVNKERVKLIGSGLSLVGGDAEAAGRVAVLFESDGPQTRQAFGAVLELVAGYLAFCGRERLDPKSADAAARFAGHP